MVMNQEETQLYNHLVKGDIWNITIDRMMGIVYIELNDGVVINIIGGEDEITVEYSGNSTVENIEKYI